VQAFIGSVAHKSSRLS